MENVNLYKTQDANRAVDVSKLSLGPVSSRCWQISLNTIPVCQHAFNLLLKNATLKSNRIPTPPFTGTQVDLEEGG